VIEVKEEGSGKNKNKTGEDGSRLPEKRDTICVRVHTHQQRQLTITRLPTQTTVTLSLQYSTVSRIFISQTSRHLTSSVELILSTTFDYK
jgi:hypothetical protein